MTSLYDFGYGTSMALSSDLAELSPVTVCVDVARRVSLNYLLIVDLYSFICFAESVVAFRFPFPFGRNTCRALEEQPWSYEGRTNGPRQWGRTYPACNGRRQSPINIYSENAELDRNEILIYVNYNVSISKADVLNNGHTVQITPTDNVRRSIMADGQSFDLQQIHFHWSKKRNEGTEHAINNRRYNMEAHFVHTNDEQETTVVAVLYRVDSANNFAFEPILEVLPSVRYQDDEADLVDSLNLQFMLPSNPSSFYRYEGSLTTPPCTEPVLWSVLKETSFVGKEQLSQFFKLYAVPKDQATSSSCRISTNVRPLQQFNDRKLVSSD